MAHGSKKIGDAQPSVVPPVKETIAPAIPPNVSVPNASGVVDEYVDGVRLQSPDAGITPPLRRSVVATTGTLFQLTSGADYDWSYGARPDKALLEEMLREIHEKQFGGVDKRMTYNAMKLTTYRSLKGKLIKSENFLAHYSHARWIADHPGAPVIGRNQVLAVKGYKYADILRAFKEEVLGNKPNVPETHRLTSGKGYDWSMGAKPDKAILEEMLKEIAQKRFKGNLDEMTVLALAHDQYLTVNGTVVRGAQFLNHYSHACWLTDHPDKKDIGRATAIHLAGYKGGEVLERFKREVMGRPPSEEAPVEERHKLTAGAGYHWEKNAKPDKTMLEEMLREIFEKQFAQDAEAMMATAIIQVTYLGPDGKKITGDLLLNHYRHACWLADHPDEKDIGRPAVLELSEYLPSKVLARFKEKVLGYQPEIETSDDDPETVETFPLASGSIDDWLPDARPDKARLEALLWDILQVQFEGDVSALRIDAVRCSHYLIAGSVRIHGYQLLSRYRHACWLADNPGEVDIGQEAVLQLRPYAAGPLLEKFLQRIVAGEFSPVTIAAADTDGAGEEGPKIFRLLTLAGQDWTKKGKAPDRDLLEGMLTEIWKSQFSEIPSAMTTSAMRNTLYRTSDSFIFSGLKLLGRYRHALWMSDNPGAQNIGQQGVAKLKRYEFGRVIKRFMREKLGLVVEEGKEPLQTYPLARVPDYDWRKGSRPDLKKLESILDEILEIQFEGEPSQMLATTIQDTEYTLPGGESLLGGTILDHYSHARWMADHPGFEDIGRGESVHQKGYRAADSIAHFKEHVLQFQNQRDVEPRRLKAATGFDWGEPGAKPNKALLVAILREILQEHFDGDPEAMTAIALRHSFYAVSSDGKKVVSGLSILKQFNRARWMADHPDAKEIPSTNKVESEDGYDPSGGLRAFLKGEGLDVDERIASVELTEGKGYNWTQRGKPDKEHLEKMLLEILRVQFGGDPESMTAKVIRNTFYAFPGDPQKIVRGWQILNHYCHACWLSDHPGADDIGKTKAKGEKGYTPTDVLAVFKKKNGFEPDIPPIDYTLETAADYRWGAQKPDKAQLESMFHEILAVQFGGNPARMTSGVIGGTIYGGPEGILIKGWTLLKRYAHACWIADHPGEKDIGQMVVVRLPDYRAADVLEAFKRTHLGYEDFKKTSREELDSFIARHDLQSILSLFADNPSSLVEALYFLRPDIFKGKDVAEFVKAYVGLDVERKRGGSGGKGEIPWEQRRQYIMQVLKSVEAGEKLDFSELNFQEQLGLLIRLSRKAFEVDPAKLIEELSSEELRILDLILEKLSPEGRVFLMRLHHEAADYFQKAHDFKAVGMRTQLYGYQQEGAHFLLTHDQAILADEAGLGKSIQVIAALQMAGFRRILWVTTASNKETIREEILGHSTAVEKDIRIVISGDPRERKAQIAALNGERYIITNYETLVALKKNDPEGYAKLTNGLNVVVLDEAQMTDNEKTLRTAATHEIKPARRWLLTATPYQHKPERIFTLLHLLDPVRYPDYRAFKRFYAESTDGLKLLHAELAKIMLRRTKGDTLTYFEDPSATSFADQLTDGIPRIPRKVRIDPNVSGAYQLSVEQQDLMAWMIADFNGWAAHFNQNLPDGAEPIGLDNINSLLKFGFLQKVIYEPQYFGLTGENPVYQALDQIVARRLAKGEKIILWGWNQSVVEALQKRYEILGVVRIDGQVTGQAREKARHAFQENQDIRILVANYQSGGVGLTLTAADAAIFVQLPDGYPLLYQAEGRHQRLIGPENVRHAKAHVEVEWMVPKYSPEFLAAITNDKLRELLIHGTLVEQTRGRLEGGEILYNLLMEGYGNVEELENYFKAGIIAALGLNREEKLDYTAHLKGEIKDYAGTIRSVLPLWNLVKGNQDGEERVLQLIEQLHYYPTFAKDLGKAFEKAGQYYKDDLQFISSLFEIKNKYIRNQIFKKLPDLIIRTYQTGRSLTEVAGDLKIGKLTPAVFLATLYAISGQKGDLIPEMARELSEQRDIPAKRYIEEHFLMGVFGIMGQRTAEEFLADHSSLFSGLTLVHKIHALYRLGLLARVRPDLITAGVALDEAVYLALGDIIGRPADQVQAMVQGNPNWRGNADHLLAFVAGWQDQNEEKIQRQFAEVLRHVIDGDYHAWRMGENNREEGEGIDYLSDSPEFWEIFSENHQSAIDRVVVEEQKARATLMKSYLAILQEFAQEGEGAEGVFVTGKIAEYRDLKDEAKQTMPVQLQEEIRDLGGKLGTNLPLLEKTADLQKITELKNVLGWINLDQSFKEISRGREPNWGSLVAALEAKIKFYHGRKYDKMAEHLDALKASVVQRSSGSIFENITIEDTDDPAILSRMGALHPEMTNCFNPNGNPAFTEHVVAALGSKNMKLVVVRSEGKIVAAAMVKVKSLEDESPVLFLERGIYRKGYDFRKEMLAHLGFKVELVVGAGFKPALTVMDEVRGKPKDTDPLVMGTGAYTGNEYVESVFGLRRSDNVKHHGRIPKTVQLDAKTIYGIGTAGKNIDDYIAELKINGVKVVVDVRDRPYSRNPVFNRDRLQASLGAAGIGYVWMGDTLGNPKVDGERTLDGFKAVMKTPRFADGMTSLSKLRKTSGRVALTCVEAAHADCHRSLIMESLALEEPAEVGQPVASHNASSFPHRFIGPALASRAASLRSPSEALRNLIK